MGHSIDMSTVRRFGALLIAGLFVVSAGCVGSVPLLNSGSSASVVNVSIGPGHGLPSDPGPDGPDVDSPPIIETNASHIVVVGEIPGVGDLSCYGARGSVSTKSNETLELTVKSIRTPSPSGCNDTGGAFYPYRIVIASEEPHPEHLSIRHRYDGEQTNNWTVAVDEGKRIPPTESNTRAEPTEHSTQAEPMTTHVSANRTK